MVTSDAAVGGAGSGLEPYIADICTANTDLRLELYSDVRSLSN